MKKNQSIDHQQKGENKRVVIKGGYVTIRGVILAHNRGRSLRQKLCQLFLQDRRYLDKESEKGRPVEIFVAGGLSIDERIEKANIALIRKRQKGKR